MDMARFVDTMQFVEDYSAYLNHLLKRCQYYVNWANSGHTTVENVTSCYSDAMMLLFKENHTKIEQRNQMTINAVQPRRDMRGQRAIQVRIMDRRTSRNGFTMTMWI